MPPEGTDNTAMIDRSKYKYTTTRIIDPDTGKHRVATHNNDAIARAMLSVKSTDLQKIARKNGLAEMGDLNADKLAKGDINAGQFRMNIGNALRGKVRKGEPVEIGDVTIKKLDQREPVVKDVPAPERKAAATEKTKAAPKRKAKAA